MHTYMLLCAVFVLENPLKDSVTPSVAAVLLQRAAFSPSVAGLELLMYHTCLHACWCIRGICMRPGPMHMRPRIPLQGI